MIANIRKYWHAKCWAGLESSRCPTQVQVHVEDRSCCYLLKIINEPWPWRRLCRYVSLALAGHLLRCAN